MLGRPTLVLDLDETLLHCCHKPFENCQVSFELLSSQNDDAKEYQTVYTAFRPFLLEFLQEVSSQFEVILFTASEVSLLTANHLETIRRLRYLNF